MVSVKTGLERQSCREFGALLVYKCLLEELADIGLFSIVIREKKIYQMTHTAFSSNKGFTGVAEILTGCTNMAALYSLFLAHLFQRNSLAIMIIAALLLSCHNF